MTIDMSVIGWVMAAIVLYYTCLFLVAVFRRSPPAAEACPLMVIMVPARNEQLVLDGTLSALAALRYDGELRILVVDDASTDDTAGIVEAWAGRDDRVRLSCRVPPEAGQGKSEVLNHAFKLVTDLLDRRDPWLAGHDAEEVVLVIVDADGKLEQAALRRVAPYFADPQVGSVQIGVRIANARTNVLTRMQDIEFVAFSWLIQGARDRLGSVGLGGNGQFARFSALAGLGGEPWRRGALTEDLDLGLRLVRAGWRTRFCHLTYVDQQGLATWKPLLRQRTRWIQGHYQCWRHLGGLARARHTPIGARLDLMVYLLLVVTVLLVTVTLAVGVLDALGVVTVTNGSLHAIPYGPPRRIASLAIAVLPLVIFLGVYQRRSAHPFSWYELPAAAMAFTLFSYVWVWASVRALARLALRRNGWVKTPRMASGVS